MSIVLGANQYGKAENRLVRVYRDTARHEIRDLNVSSALRGDFSDAHISGDQAAILPTDTQKNTVFALAKEKGVRSIEDFAITLGDHLIHQTPLATGARIEIEEYFWDRISVDGAPHDHSFVRNGSETRTTVVTVEGRGANQKAWAVSGIKDLTLAKTTGSEFKGFLKDEYTTLQETSDRILATSLIARWRYDTIDVDFDKSYQQIRAMLLKRFAEVHSYALQQTLYAMGESVLQEYPEVAEIRFKAPNKHHFLVDLSPFGDENPGEVFWAADRPYGLIEAAVQRDDASDPGSAWNTVPGFC
ncbi:MAG: factor-independent urate hydroxylase [Nakamurella sp.]